MLTLPQFQFDKRLLLNWKAAFREVSLGIEEIGPVQSGTEAIQQGWKCFDEDADLFFFDTYESKDRSVFGLVTGPRAARCPPARASAAFDRFEHVLIASGARCTSLPSRFESYYSVPISPSELLQRIDLRVLGIEVEPPGLRAQYGFPACMLQRDSTAVFLDSGPIIVAEGQSPLWFFTVSYGHSCSARRTFRRKLLADQVGHLFVISGARILR